MAKISRGTAQYSAPVAVGIDKLWELLIDWGNLSWLDNHVEAEGMVLGSIALEGAVDAVPRTRVLTRANATEAGLPLVNREVLLLEDRTAYRLYYDAENGFIRGVRNYIANWALDPISENACQMTISANFDVDETGSAEATKEIVEEVYVMIISSMNTHFA